MGGGEHEPLARLKKRRDFLAAAKARRQGSKSLTVQARCRAAEEGPGIRVGFTCSKKLGNAVTRNRAKRRLREAARLTLPGLACEGWDYVLVGRPQATVATPFAELVAEIAASLARLHGRRE